MGYSLGIDLGTTFSAAGLTQDGRTEIFPLGNRAATIPSVVVLRADGEVLIGDAAVRRSITEPMRTAREFKRRLGDPTPLLLGGTPYGAESLMARLLDGIVRQVVEQQGEEPEQIVVSHPANYGPYKLDLLEQAVRMAEIGNVSFIAEPIAAALHYTQRERIEPGEIVAVYDFGGGTFDAALLRRTADSFEQMGEPEGIERLGGIDFDEAVFAHVVNALGEKWHQLDPSDPATISAVARLRDDCREAKEGLSVDTDATIPVLLPGIQTEVRITRSEFEEMIRPRIHETIAALMRAVRSAGVEVSDIARVLLVGGSSRIPLVGQMVREATGVPIALDAHPKHAIALGAAIAASHSVAVAEPETTITPAAAPIAQDVVVPADSGTGGPAEPPPPPVAAPPPDDGSRLPVSELVIGGVVAAVLLVGLVTFLAFQFLGGDDDPDDTADVASVLGAEATATPEHVHEEEPTATATTPPTATTEPAAVADEPDPTATEIPPSPTPEPTHTPEPTPTPTSVPNTPTPTVEPTPTPPVPPGVEYAWITDIEWHEEHQHYHIHFDMYELEIEHPDGIDDPHTSQMARPHVHFFTSNVAPEDAGVPGSGPWKLYAGPSPFNEFTPADIPADATEICVLIANPDHSVQLDTGNCFAIPPRS